MRLLITRPTDDAEGLAQALTDRGIETMIEPMMSVADVAGPDPDMTRVQAILITSANGIRAFARRTRERATKVYAVGDASARTARDLGFRDVASASGDVEALASLVRAELDPGRGALIHVAGTHVAGNLSRILEDAEFEVRRQVIYEAVAANRLSAEAAAAFATGALDGVLLFSPRTAEIFVNLVTAAGFAGACAALDAYCLSQAVAQEAGHLVWRHVFIARDPDQDALLALIETPAEDG